MRETSVNESCNASAASFSLDTAKAINRLKSLKLIVSAIHTRNGISAVYVKPEIPEEVFDRLMNWAVENLDSLLWSKNNPKEDVQGLNPYGSRAIDSWNELWKELQNDYPHGTDECEAIGNFETVVSDNPEILVWVRSFYQLQH